MKEVRLIGPRAGHLLPAGAIVQLPLLRSSRRYLLLGLNLA